jgi:hypothetical protein
VWPYLLRETLLLDSFPVRLRMLGGDDVARQLRAVMRFGLLDLVGAAAAHSSQVQVVDAIQARQDWLTLPTELAAEYDQVAAVAEDHAPAFAVARRASILEGVLRLVLQGAARQQRLGVGEADVLNATFGDLLKFGASAAWDDSVHALPAFFRSPVVAGIVKFRNDEAHARFGERNTNELRDVDAAIRDVLPHLLREAPVLGDLEGRVAAGIFVRLRWALIPRVVCVRDVRDVSQGTASSKNAMLLLHRARLLQSIGSSASTVVPAGVLLQA